MNTPRRQLPRIDILIKRDQGQGVRRRDDRDHFVLVHRVSWGLCRGRARRQDQGSRATSLTRKPENAMTCSKTSIRFGRQVAQLGDAAKRTASLASSSGSFSPPARMWALVAARRVQTSPWMKQVLVPLAVKGALERADDKARATLMHGLQSAASGILLGPGMFIVGGYQLTYEVTSDAVFARSLSGEGSRPPRR
jgi:hypothetical protein